MKYGILLILSLMVVLPSCKDDRAKERSRGHLEKERIVEQRIGKEKALEIAHKDAQTAYRDLSIYDITIKAVDGNWQVDYELKDKTIRGGGPHYTISGSTGEIVSKRYEQ